MQAAGEKMRLATDDTASCYRSKLTKNFCSCCLPAEAQTLSDSDSDLQKFLRTQSPWSFSRHRPILSLVTSCRSVAKYSKSKRCGTGDPKEHAAEEEV